jgi:uncharacterized protein (TIGR04255 family)
MSSWLQFPNPPITEAILDLRVELPEEIGLGQLAEFQTSIRARFPGRRTKVMGQAKVAISEESGLKLGDASVAAIGYLFTAKDNSRIVQARRDGFTFNWLQRYETWAALRDEARPLWKHFCEIARPKYVERVALRYINRIEIPLPLNDFADYVLFAPQVPTGLPQGLQSFLMRLVIPHPEYEAIAIITEATEPVESGSTVLPLIFDIDVFREARHDTGDESIWQTLEKLRHLKNEIFHGSMTAKAKALFQ